jgi:hypothetical protein
MACIVYRVGLDGLEIRLGAGPYIGESTRQHLFSHNGGTAGHALQETPPFHGTSLGFISIVSKCPESSPSPHLKTLSMRNGVLFLPPVPEKGQDFPIFSDRKDMGFFFGREKRYAGRAEGTKAW